MRQEGEKRKSNRKRGSSFDERSSE